MIDKHKEEEFYAKSFNFSYSSLNKLLHSPSLFYKDYILLDREIKTDKHLIEGKLIHCLLFEPDELSNKFNIIPGKLPSDNIKRVMKDMYCYTKEKDLDKIEDKIILNSLKYQNLYQALKTDESRISKVKTEDNKPYWKFLSNSTIDIIDQDVLDKCKRQVEILKENKDVKSIFNIKNTDFELDSDAKAAEQYLKCPLKDKSFGLHGFIDYYKIDSKKQTVTIYDLKTTSKTISDFPETVEYYNYWLQAAIYTKLVYDSVDKEISNTYNFLFKFVVIDKYNQVYVFEVSDQSMSVWANELAGILDIADHHYSNRSYELPYNFLVNQQLL